MKKISFCLLALVIGNVAIAQLNSNLIQNHRMVIGNLLSKQVTNKPTQKVAFTQRALSERVIGQRTIDNTLSSYADSVNVNYIVNGTSTFDFNSMLYPYNYPYSTSPMFNFMGIFTKPQILFDTYNHFTVNPNDLVYGFYQRDKNTYDANKNLTNCSIIYKDSADLPNQIYDNRFNVANNVDTCYANNYVGGVSSPAFKQFFSYNASNLITKDSVYEYVSGTWYLVSKTFYLYDGSNNLIKIDQWSNTQDTTYSLPLIEQFQYLNTYDGSNRLKAVVTSFWDGAALNPYVRDTFNYGGSTIFHTDWKEYQYDAINAYWAPMMQMQKNLNGAGLPDSININLFDSLANMWVPSCKQIWTYDSYDNPTKLDEYWFNFVSFPTTPDFETVYYYQVFTNTTEVNSEVGESINFNLFPNPSNGNMILNYSINESAILNIYDQTGKLLNAFNLSSQNKSININQTNLTNGIYFYKIISNDKVLHNNKFILVK